MEKIGAGIKLELSDDMGDLLLGKLSQEYTTDPDLRDILANAFLDKTKIDCYSEQQLLLITSVVYSERFQLLGEIKHQVLIGPFRVKCKWQILIGL